MFSKSKINEPAPKADEAKPAPSPESARPAAPDYKSDFKPSAPKAKVEGTDEGDIRAHLLTIGESATIKGEVIADDVVINGRIVGRVRGLKVRLTATARVEGDIIHKTIAIESGAHFEGSVQRQDDPLNPGAKAAPAQKANPAS